LFTGIIEEIGKVDGIQQQGESFIFTIRAARVLKDVQLGDSISVNGVCLTVTSYNKHSFTVDIMPETVRATSLKMLSTGSKVNLERAMAANGRFGGHFVSGHIDGIGKITRKEQVDNAVYYDVEVPQDLLHFIIDKGSVAVDGTSLTVFGISDHSFTLSIIPHTLSETVIGEKKVGDIVNIECDVVGKYIERFLTQRFSNKEENGHALSKDFLKEHGYL
jgi:riboflavin synthase